MPFGLSDKNLNLIRDVFKYYPKIDEVIIFGSRAMGTEKNGSDIDLAVKGKDILLDDILSISSKLDELPLAYDYDVINYADIDNPALTEHIDKHGLPFYKKEEVKGEWKKYKLGEIAVFKNGKSRPLEVGIYPVYGGNGILGYVDKYNSENEVVIVGRVGAYCGSVFYENNPIWISDNAMYAFPQKGNDTKFLYYQLKKLDLNKYAQGSSHPLLTQNLLNAIQVEIPDLETQKEIASILSSLDEKIEINQQMNETLEAMAQAIFKEWFVDFEFPESPLTPLYQRGGLCGSEDGVGSGKRESVEQKNERFFDEDELKKRGLISDGGYLPYNPKLKEKARELRNNMTVSEKKLWKDFLQKSEHNWLRQKPLDHYIVDFYCPAFKLVIEVDGSHHFTEEGLAYDQIRTEILSLYGIKVIRFTNNEVLKEFESVCEKINSVINEIKQSSPNQPEIINQQNLSSTTSALTPPFVKGGQGGFKSSGGEFINGLPKGWRMGTLNEICSNIRNPYNPKNIDIDYHYIGLEHIPRKSWSIWEWGHSSDIGSQKSMFTKGDISVTVLEKRIHPNIVKIT
jgi:type I restriction enzyme S subunit